MTGVEGTIASIVRRHRDGDVLVLTIDNPPVNASSAQVRQGLLDGIAELDRDPELIGMVVIGDHGTFIAGSDLREFGGTLPAPLLPVVIAAIESSPKPVVAAIDGHALGGGFELTLGCDARIFTDRARVGLPEVSLGMVPGAGGTQRLPRLTGRARALKLIVASTRLTAREAAEVGIADAVVEPDDLLSVATSWARTGGKRVLLDIPLAAPDDQFETLALQLTSQSPSRPQVAESVRLVRRAGTSSAAELLRDERAVFDRLRLGPEAAALRHVFFAERAAGSRAVERGVAVPRLMSSAVIGAGSMGIGIAYVLAAAGQDVALVDQNESALDVATTSLAAIAQRSVDRGRIGPADAAALISRISRSTELDAVADVDLVIEAVFEDLDLKCRLLADVEAVVDGRAVLATNTSYLDVERMADGLKDPTRLIGMHFFNPVPAMRLVEVVRARRSDPVAVAAALGLVVRLGKQPVVAQAAEGFVGNRLFAASRRHAEYLIEDGATPAQVDAAARTFGFAMGPFATADLWG